VSDPLELPPAEPAAGVPVDLTPAQGAERLADPGIGWAYVDQKVFWPKLHDLAGLRMLIVKRPALSTAEGLAGLIRGRVRPTSSPATCTNVSAHLCVARAGPRCAACSIPDRHGGGSSAHAERSGRGLDVGRAARACHGRAVEQMSRLESTP